MASTRTTALLLYLLAALGVCLPASAQVMADAGTPQTVNYPSSAQLDGDVENGTPLEWWTADGNGETEDYLLKINEQTGITAVGPLRSMTGLTYGYPGDIVKVGSVFYGVDVARRILYTLDPATGICTNVGGTYSTQWMNVHSLAYDAVHNKLFAVDIVKKQLLLFNRTTGQATTVGAGTLGGYPLVRSLAYDPSIDRLYAVDQQTDMLLKVHPTTGAVTPVITLTPDPTARIEELEIVNGQLYASNGLLTNGVLTGEEFLKINITNGTSEVMGPTVSSCSPHCLYIASLPEDTLWLQTGGPGLATFSNNKLLDPTVTFSAPGIYTLELRVFTGGGFVSDTVSITSDGCPSDPDKVLPGTCGCGVADTDTDGDGTPDCVDACENDPNKTAPGACGCGVADVDSDEDGTLDCNDGCPNDPAKIAPGDCGCGAPDTDGDEDGTADCIDGCPSDPNKIEPGVCGCGVADIDTDGDGTLDCVDGCPTDPGKIASGVCGCGVADVDTDGDGTLDCLDACPSDPAKVAPGACGCGNPETDGDGDGMPDCIDGCPSDANKFAPGACGCGAPDTDGDGDGTADCIDGCPSDPSKIVPGACGCGTPDVDSDGDFFFDCEDNCPSSSNPGQEDLDQDLVGNACDNCVDIPNASQADCDEDGIGDVCEIAIGSQLDLNFNGLPDDCEVDCAQISTYCTAKVNSSGCVPAMTWSGTPSASLGSGFSVGAAQVLADKAGLVFYSIHGPGGAPFQGGTLCATPPTKRTAIQTATSAGAPPCTGTFAFDFNVHVASGIDPTLIAGQEVWAQYWTRDAGMPSGTGLTNGLTFTICP